MVGFVFVSSVRLPSRCAGCHPVDWTVSLVYQCCSSFAQRCLHASDLFPSKQHTDCCVFEGRLSALAVDHLEYWCFFFLHNWSSVLATFPGSLSPHNRKFVFFDQALHFGNVPLPQWHPACSCSDSISVSYTFLALGLRRNAILSGGLFDSWMALLVLPPSRSRASSGTTRSGSSECILCPCRLLAKSKVP